MTESASNITSMTPRAQANRDKIYEVAIDLFRERGYDSVTMQDIARASGVARASVFNHFPAKLVFLAEWFERFTSQSLEAARQEPAITAAQRVESLCEVFGKGAHENRDIIVHIASLAMGHGPLAAKESELDQDLEDFFKQIIVDAQSDGEIKTDQDPDFLAKMFVGLLTVTAHDWVNQGQENNLSDDLKARFKMLFDGISH